ncbi:hypothetical protein DPMN_151805 [Dreissena polymorpha]|uniref:Uncharacterized protein n=1 Tax=Dreissena polymorpha TaxID=45954 RepID=A0A9D4FHV5_DREPO|nr:hypothetical protein DPMN_151805 [Dreissena polymorpha]
MTDLFCATQDIIKTNVLIKFHAELTSPPPGDHVFQETGTIEIIQDIKTNALTEFYEEWIIHVTLRVLTRFYYIHIMKTAPPLVGHVFQPTGTIFSQDIIGTNHLTRFHDDRTKDVASRMLTRKNAPHPGDHAFQPNGTIFKLVQDIIGTNLRTKFHDKRTIYEKCVAPWRQCVNKQTETIFELVHDIIGTNLLTKFHEDLTVNVASRGEAENYNGRGMVRGDNPKKSGRANPNPNPTPNTNPNPNPNPLTPPPPCAIPYHASPVVSVNMTHVEAAQRTTHHGQKAITMLTMST